MNDDNVFFYAALVLIASIYFVQTIIPTFAIIEVVFRGNVAVSFLAALTANAVGVFSATFLIWFVNLILPALAGLVLFTRHRVFVRPAGAVDPIVPVR